jgi:hypothetical protein
MVMDHIDRTIDPRTFFAPGSGIQPNALSNFFRRILPIRGRAADAVWVDRPNILGEEVRYLLQEIPHMMQSIIAQPEVLQGIRPAGTRSGKAIEQLAYQAMPRTNKKLLRFEESVKILVEKMVMDYLVGIGEYGIRKIGNEYREINPGDFLDAMVKVEIVPGSSMGSYADEKINKIVALAGAMQGLPPQLQKILMDNSGIPELQGISQGTYEVPEEGGNEPPMTSPEQAAGAMNVSLPI